MAKILVTGGAGLIGSFLSEKLVSSGHTVTVVDDLCRGLEKNVPVDCTFIQDDAANLASLVPQTFDVIYHLASFMFGIGFSAKNHLELYRRNALINDGVLAFISQRPPKRLVLISSSCVYSDNGPDLVDENTPLGDFPEKANIGYGYAKRHMEDRLKMASMLYGFELSIARPFNIYGERYKWAGDFSQAIPMLVNKIMTQDKVIVWGSGQQKRTYIHAADCAEILCRLGLQEKCVELLNIGTEETISLNNLTEKLIKISGRSIQIENDLSKPEGRFIKSCTRDQLVKSFPDFKYRVMLDEGLVKMVQWWDTSVPK